MRLNVYFGTSCKRKTTKLTEMHHWWYLQITLKTTPKKYVWSREMANFRLLFYCWQRHEKTAGGFESEESQITPPTPKKKLIKSKAVYSLFCIFSGQDLQISNYMAA